MCLSIISPLLRLLLSSVSSCVGQRIAILAGKAFSFFSRATSSHLLLRIMLHPQYRSWKRLVGFFIHTGFQDEHMPDTISEGHIVWGPQTCHISFFMSPEARRGLVLACCLTRGMSNRTEQDFSRALAGPKKASSVITGRPSLLPQVTILYPSSSFFQMLRSLARQI